MPMTIGGQTYSDDQIKQFYAGGGNDSQFLQQNGMTDQGQMRDLAMQGRGIAGSANATGDAAVQQNFQRYQQYNPNGANVNNYQAWAQEQDPASIGAMRAGTFTGAAVSPKDYAPGGIYGPGSASYGKPGYASGLGAQGNGGGWGSGNASGGGGQSGGGGGSSNLGFGGAGSYGGSSGGQGGGPNPYLSSMADDIGRRSNQALGSALNGIRGNSVATGGLGGSRQGVAEGTAIGNAQDTLQGNLANLYGTDWTNGQNRNLQYYNTNTNAALTNQGQMQNFYSTNRGQDLQQLGLGAQLFGQGNAGMLSQGKGIYGIGNTQQNAPFGVINNANGAISPYTGFGATNTQTGQQGGGFNGMVGGALSGAQIGKNLGFGGSSSYGNSEPYPGYNASIGM